MSSEDKLFKPKNAPKPPVTTRKKEEPRKELPSKVKAVKPTKKKETSPSKPVAKAKVTKQEKPVPKKPSPVSTPKQKQKAPQKPQPKVSQKKKAPEKKAPVKKDKVLKGENKKKQIKENKTAIPKEEIQEESILSMATKKIPRRDKDFNSVQNFLPFDRFLEGMIVTTDYRYIGVMEVNGLDFTKTIYKEDVINRFGRMFDTSSIRISIKILTDTPSPRSQIEMLNRRKTPGIEHIRSDVVNKILYLSNGGTYEKRYFIIYEYMGEESGTREEKEEKIISQMRVSRKSLITQLTNMGIKVLNPEATNAATAEFLYFYFNRQSKYYQSFEQRREEVKKNVEVFNKTLGRKIPARAVDYIAPRGLDMSHNDYLVMDGVYYTYLTVKTESWPTVANGIWIPDFDSFGAFLDIDIITKVLPKDIVQNVLEKKNQLANQIIQINSSNSRIGAEDRQRKRIDHYNNTRMITEALKRGENIFNVLIIFTLKATSKKVLFEKRAELKEYLRSEMDGMKAMDSYLECDEFFKQLLPVGYTSKIFNRYSHNLTTEGVTSLFPFTQHRLNDPKGVVLGYLTNFGSLASIDVFNTQKYENANMAIFGSSGGGKTFTQELIAESLYLQGKRLWFILPKKGYEYEEGCKRLNGNYIKLTPGSKSRINICAIIPREGDAKKSSDSWKVAKVSSLTVWINLLLGEKERLTIEENSRLVTLLSKFYNKYDITDDNESIFKEDGSVKPMPTLGDLYSYILQQGDLERVALLLQMFVKGNYSSLNGQTNVDTSSGYVVFDINEELIPEEHLAAFLYIAFDYVDQKVKENLRQYDVLMMDEYWKMLQSPECANQVKDCLKIFRGYGGSVILATQELKDCLSSEEGKSVINNTSIKLCLKTKPIELELVQKAAGISDSEAQLLLGLFHQGMFITNDERTLIDIHASEMEREAFNTDITQEIEKDS